MVLLRAKVVILGTCVLPVLLSVQYTNVSPGIQSKPTLQHKGIFLSKRLSTFFFFPFIYLFFLIILFTLSIDVQLDREPENKKKGRTCRFLDIRLCTMHLRKSWLISFLDCNRKVVVWSLSFFYCNVYTLLSIHAFTCSS